MQDDKIRSQSRGKQKQDISTALKKVYKCLKKGQTARVLNMIHRNREEDEEGDEDAGAKMLQKEERMLQRT